MQILLRYLKLLLHNFKESNLTILAGNLSFMTLVSLIPFFAISISTTRWMGKWSQQVLNVADDLLGYLTAGTGQDFQHQVETLINRVDFQLVGAVGYGFLVFTSWRLLRSVTGAFAAIWGDRTSKMAWWQRNLLRLGLIFLGMPGLAVAFGLLSQLSSEFISGRVLSILVVLSLLFFLYKYLAPKIVPIKAALPAAITVGITLYGVKAGFSWVNASFMDYDRLYGSLAYLPLFLVWIYLQWMVLLSGVVLCASLTKEIRDPGF